MKPILIDIYADWCGWCKKLDKNTFQHPDIVEYVNENFYAVKLDAEMRTPVTVSGREYKYITDGRRGTHELALALTNGQMSLPTMVVLSSKMAQMGIIPGYQEPTDLWTLFCITLLRGLTKKYTLGAFSKKLSLAHQRQINIAWGNKGNFTPIAPAKIYT
ncbi:MAG: thioredoxin family protein [Sphingobacteriales bacterium]|nr:thioredoxin family protein [Sphingobacteriales bacterium]